MKFVYSSLLFTAFLTSSSFAALRIGGSDLMEPDVRSALEYQLEFQGVDADFDLSGTYGAFERLREGDFDLAFLAIPDGQEVSDEGVRLVPLAYKTVAVAVPAGNPLNQISMSDLAAIFGQGETSTINRWGQLGLSGDWAARSIAPVAVTPVQHSLALDLFRYTALRSPQLRRNITYVADVDEVEEHLNEQANAIALLPHLRAAGASGLKILSIGSGDEDDGAVMPTADSLHSGDYPLRLPVYVAFDPEKGSEVREVLRLLVGAETAEALEASGLTPLPELQRQRLYFEFEQL